MFVRGSHTEVLFHTWRHLLPRSRKTQCFQATLNSKCLGPWAPIIPTIASKVGLLSPLNRWELENWKLERWNDLPKATQQINGRGGVWTWVGWVPFSSHGSIVTFFCWRESVSWGCGLSCLLVTLSAPSYYLVWLFSLPMLGDRYLCLCPISDCWSQK